MNEIDFCYWLNAYLKTTNSKELNEKQLKYEKKNWSSFVIYNQNHKDHQLLKMQVSKKYFDCYQV